MMKLIKENRNYIYDNHFEDLINEIKKICKVKNKQKKFFWNYILEIQKIQNVKFK